MKAIIYYAKQVLILIAFILMVWALVLQFQQIRADKEIEQLKQSTTYFQ